MEVPGRLSTLCNHSLYCCKWSRSTEERFAVWCSAIIMLLIVDQLALGGHRFLTEVRMYRFLKLQTSISWLVSSLNRSGILGVLILTVTNIVFLGSFLFGIAWEYAFMYEVEATKIDFTPVLGGPKMRECVYWSAHVGFWCMARKRLPSVTFVRFSMKGLTFRPSGVI